MFEENKQKYIRVKCIANTQGVSNLFANLHFSAE